MLGVDSVLALITVRPHNESTSGLTKTPDVKKWKKRRDNYCKLYRLEYLKISFLLDLVYRTSSRN